MDNLCKDLFLRRHMDSYGFVFLTVIANFNRIRQLTQDLDMLRHACFMSQTIELYHGSDGQDRVRRRQGWEMWLLALEDRDPSVQNAPHPVFLSAPPAAAVEGQSAQAPRQSVASVETTSYVGERDSAVETTSNVGEHHSAVEKTSNVDEHHSAVETNGGPPPMVQSVYPPVVNGTTNGNPVSTQPTPLSATVAEFSPVGALSAFQQETPTVDQDQVDVFPDEQVDCLMIFVGERDRPTVPIAHRPAGARSYSNGSIDEETIAEALDPATTQGDSPLPGLATLYV